MLQRFSVHTSVLRCRLMRLAASAPARELNLVKLLMLLLG